MRINIFVIESEKPNSPTSIRGIYNEVRNSLAKAGALGQCVFLDALTRENLLDAAKTFSAWTKTIPAGEPVVLWPSIHGANPEPGVEDAKRKLVGTSGASSASERVRWEDFFAAVKKSQEPGRVVVLMDVCWGSSPTAPRSLTQPPDTRPAIVFGPARNAKRSELDAASRALFGHLEKLGIPDAAAAKKIVDSLNSTYKAAPGTGTPFYRVWWWDADGIHRHPELPPKVRPKR